MSKSVKFNSFRQKPLVLLSPLDWGLGHTTRCFPVIQELIDLDCEVIVACNQRQQSLLGPEFPNLRFVELAGYNMHYGSSKWQTITQLLLQFPKMAGNIRREHRWLQHFLQQEPVDAVISDNRFGLYTSSIPSIFITHQLAVKTSLGSAADRLAQRINYRFINRFTSCWVPDFQGEAAIAGELSNPIQRPGIPVDYLGGLSRFHPCPDATAKKPLLVILSGPEPQRTIFEHLLLQQLELHGTPATIVRAMPGEEGIPKGLPPYLTLKNHVSAAELNQLICQSDLIISRPGYTTVMDLLKLGKQSILIATPGQGEQEYLATHLHRQQLAYTVPQEKFELPSALMAAREFPFRRSVYNMECYQPVLRQFVEQLKAKLEARSVTDKE